MKIRSFVKLQLQVHKPQIYKVKIIIKTCIIYFIERVLNRLQLSLYPVIAYFFTFSCMCRTHVSLR